MAVGLVARPRPLPPLDAILASHPLLHAAEGELFRRALAEAAGAAGLPLIQVPPRELRDRAEDSASRAGAGLAALLDRLGHELGPPWRRDHKEATMVAVLALEGPQAGSISNRSPNSWRR